MTIADWISLPMTFAVAFVLSRIQWGWNYGTALILERQLAREKTGRNRYSTSLEEGKHRKEVLMVDSRVLTIDEEAAVKRGHYKPTPVVSLEQGREMVRRHRPLRIRKAPDLRHARNKRAVFSEIDNEIRANPDWLQAFLSSDTYYKEQKAAMENQNGPPLPEGPGRDASEFLDGIEDGKS